MVFHSLENPPSRYIQVWVDDSFHPADLCTHTHTLALDFFYPTVPLISRKLLRSEMFETLMIARSLFGLRWQFNMRRQILKTCFETCLHMFNQRLGLCSHLCCITSYNCLIVDVLGVHTMGLCNCQVGRSVLPSLREYIQSYRSYRQKKTMVRNWNSVSFLPPSSSPEEEMVLAWKKALEVLKPGTGQGKLKYIDV